MFKQAAVRLGPVTTRLGQAGLLVTAAYAAKKLVSEDAVEKASTNQTTIQIGRSRFDRPFDDVIPPLGRARVKTVRPPPKDENLEILEKHEVSLRSNPKLMDLFEAARALDRPFPPELMHRAFVLLQKVHGEGPAQPGSRYALFPLEHHLNGADADAAFAMLERYARHPEGAVWAYKFFLSVKFEGLTEANHARAKALRNELYASARREGWA